MRVPQQSNLDDDEINGLLLTEEEARKKTILWEKMNQDFLQEQVIPTSYIYIYICILLTVTLYDCYLLW